MLEVIQVTTQFHVSVVGVGIFGLTRLHKKRVRFQPSVDTENKEGGEKNTLLQTLSRKSK